MRYLPGLPENSTQRNSDNRLVLNSNSLSSYSGGIMALLFLGLIIAVRPFA
jgi:hypothetical protein